jgi:hypothetical protein
MPCVRLGGGRLHTPRICSALPHQSASAQGANFPVAHTKPRCLIRTNCDFLALTVPPWSLHDTLIQQRVSSASRRLALAVELLCSAQFLLTSIDLAPAWLRPLSALPSIDLPRSRKVPREYRPTRWSSTRMCPQRPWRSLDPGGGLPGSPPPRRLYAGRSDGRGGGHN